MSEIENLGGKMSRRINVFFVLVLSIEIRDMRDESDGGTVDREL